MCHSSSSPGSRGLSVISVRLSFLFSSSGFRFISFRFVCQSFPPCCPLSLGPVSSFLSLSAFSFLSFLLGLVTSFPCLTFGSFVVLRCSQSCLLIFHDITTYIISSLLLYTNLGLLNPVIHTEVYGVDVECLSCLYPSSQP